MLRVGVDYGGTKIAFGLYDEDMCLLARKRVRTDVHAQPDTAIDAMARDIAALVQGAGRTMEEVMGVGVGFPCHVSFEDGRVIIATNLPIWEDVPLRDMLAQRMGLPAYLDNDTNCATLAEHRLGAGQGARHMVYFTVSTGIGCGFVINGDMFRGTHGFAGELGQVFVSDTEGYGSTRTNAGVIQSIASGPQIARYAREQVAAGRKSAILDCAGSLDAIDCEHIGRALAQGDALAEEIVNRTALYLGRMLVNLFELTDIGTIVYGGGVTKLGPRLTQGMIDAFYGLSHGARKCPVDIRPAAFGEDAGLIGAALICG